MRLIWWVQDHIPFVIVRRSTVRARERNAFQIGRDYESAHPASENIA